MACTRTMRCLLAGAVALLSVAVHAADYAQERQEMLDAIRASVRETADYTGLTQLSEEVMAAMGAVPRERFVLPSLRHMAHDNTALPIAEGQTISQPLIVALMTHLVQPSSDDIILEVGTGSGYQAAVLAELVKHVYSIEIIPELADGAADLLAELEYNNVTVRAGDGYAGWPEHAPFDGIIVTAAADEIPPPLLQQLRPGGRLVIPVGPSAGHQELLVVEVDEQGEIAQRSVLPVRFVPLTGEH
ncbi:MAG: protein-L-isoaspartate(D-aspartate) O-methyltransferase [Halioglobus sp.]|nr:protein-L-isoaspartate(D-aspartate) O-methyltransferase [Halioglobus sp.]